MIEIISFVALVGPLQGCRSRAVRTVNFFQEKYPQGLNFPFTGTQLGCIKVQTNIKMGYNSESNNDEEYIFGGPCRTFVGLSIVRCPHL